MSRPQVNTYANATPLECTRVEQPIATTLGGRVTWTWDNETGTLEQLLPDGGKLYFLAPDAEILYTLLHGVAARLATCSNDMKKRLTAGYRKITADSTVIYSPGRNYYEQE